MREHDDVIRRVKEQLDLEAERLDYATQLALKQAREKALAQTQTSEAASEPTGSPLGASWKWLAGAAASVVLALTLWWQPAANVKHAVSQEPALYADLDLLATEEPIELFEDLDFYLWLDEENETISA